MEAPAASEASKLLSDLESCATELMFGGNETEIADSVGGDLLGEDFVKSQFIKSEGDTYGAWAEEHKSLIEAMELFKPEGQEKEWSKLADAPLLDLPTGQEISPDLLKSAPSVVSSVVLPTVPLGTKPTLAQASQSLPYPASRTPQSTQATEVAATSQEKSPKRKAAAAASAARPRKKIKQEASGEKPAAAPSSLSQSTFSLSSLPTIPPAPTSVLPSGSPPPSSPSPIPLKTKPQSTSGNPAATLPNPLTANTNSSAHATTNSNGISPTDKSISSTDKDGLSETTANQLLDENLHVISVMRENLVNGKVAQNFELMMRFSNNIGSVLKWLQTLSGVQMPPLPVKLNTYFFNTTTTLPPTALLTPNLSSGSSSGGSKREGEL